MGKIECIVIGSAGVGKSTFLNQTFGSNFKTARQANACTSKPQKFTSHKFPLPVTVWDVPGVLDGETSITEWASEIKASTNGTTFSHVILVVNACERVGMKEGLMIIALANMMTDFSFERHVVVVFTHCDCATQALNREWRTRWIDSFNTKCKISEQGKGLVDSRKAVVFVAEEPLRLVPARCKLIGDALNISGYPSKDDLVGTFSRWTYNMLNENLSDTFRLAPQLDFSRMRQQYYKAAVIEQIPVRRVVRNDHEYRNDWALRDRVAIQEGTYNNGRYSRPLFFGGRVFCCMRRQDAWDSYITLDNGTNKRDTE